MVVAWFILLWHERKHNRIAQLGCNVVHVRLVMFDLEGTQIDEDEVDPFYEYLTAVSYTIRSSYHQLVFGRDMFLPVSTDIDWNAIRANKQTKIDKNNARENSK